MQDIAKYVNIWFLIMNVLITIICCLLIMVYHYLMCHKVTKKCVEDTDVILYNRVTGD